MTAWRLERFAELGSTSDVCIARAKAGEAAGLAVQAQRQTAGRGSRGRAWQAPAGNLNLSVLLRPDLATAQTSVFPFLAGLAVAEAAEMFLPASVKTLLKWPNDVLIGGAKLAGILIDAAPMGERLEWLVIGIGMNLRQAPQIVGRATTTLADHAGFADGEAAAGTVLGRLAAWLDVLEASGPSVIYESWLGRAHPIGTSMAAGERHGMFAGLSTTGALLLQTAEGVATIHTGEILLDKQQAEPCCW